MSDQEYFDSRRLDFPGMLTLPEVIQNDQEFLRVIGDPQSTQAAIQHQILRMQRRIPRLRALEFTSPELSSVDDLRTRGRILLLVPGPPFDQWIQFSRNTGAASFSSAEGRPRERTNPNAHAAQLSIVAVQTHRRDGTPLLRPVTRFNDLWRVRNPETGEVRISTRLAEQGQLERCHGCHYSGPIPIYPSPEVRPWAHNPRGHTQDLVNYFNDRIASYRVTQIDGLNHEALGPPLGARNPGDISDTLLRRCAEDVSPSRYNSLRDAMNCAQCHNDRGLPAIRFPAFFSGPADNMIVRGMMPPSSSLSRQERQALVRCLYYDSYGYRATPYQRERGLTHIQGRFVESLDSPACQRLERRGTPSVESTSTPVVEPGN